MSVLSGAYNLLIMHIIITTVQKASHCTMVVWTAGVHNLDCAESWLGI